jgi:pyruvate formate lyase activating enzyme
MQVKGRIFNIQRFSIHDGPGARTAVFFKGCNLRCVWCHNPESIETKPALEFYPQKCIGCGACFKNCPVSAHMIMRFGENGEPRHIIDRNRCTRCLACVDTCYAGALAGIGREVTAEYVVNAVKSDLPYYERSDGGVTVTGGECMIQPDFLYAVLAGCKEAGIHTAVDTAGNVPWEYFERILPVTDMFLYDVKAASPEVHHELTGADNNRIIANLRELCIRGLRVWVRVPYVPGFNDGELSGIAALLAYISGQSAAAGHANAIEAVEVLPFHKLGVSKYEALGIDNPTEGVEPPSDAEIGRAVALLRAKGLNARKS